jgi:uncharacterized repeat protein (TIGR01451 family)
MKSLLQFIRTHHKAGLVLAASLFLRPALASAAVSNTASATFADAARSTYTVTTLTVVTITPPVISGSTTAVGDVGVVFTPYNITASNMTAADGPPLTYNATGLPGGLLVNSGSGAITGTPTIAGVFAVPLTATNAAGVNEDPFTLTITIRGAPLVALTKTADRATARRGQTITYTIAYSNTGTGAASNLVIKDVVPAATTLVGGSITGGGTATAGTITWTIPTVAAGGSGSVSFQVTAN